MLYRDQTHGKTRVWARLAGRLALWRQTQRQADLDLLSMSAHLRRDVGLDADSVFRK